MSAALGSKEYICPVCWIEDQVYYDDKAYSVGRSIAVHGLPGHHYCAKHKILEPAEDVAKYPSIVNETAEARAQIPDHAPALLKPFIAELASRKIVHRFYQWTKEKKTFVCAQPSNHYEAALVGIYIKMHNLAWEYDESTQCIHAHIKSE